MNGLRNSALVAALLSTGAWAAPRLGASLLQGLLRDSRAAYFRGEYAVSMRLAMEVLLEDPADPDAGDLLRQSARILADQEVAEVQRERQSLLESARELHLKREERRRREESLRKREEREFDERLSEADKTRPAWSAWMRAYIAHGEFLEAFRLIYLVKDQFPKEPWVGVQLERVAAAIERDKAELEARPAWFLEAVRGYQAFTAGRLAEADRLWRSALSRPGAETYPHRETIVTRLRESSPGAPIPPASTPRPAAGRRAATPAKASAPAAPPAPPAPPPPPVAPTAKDIEALYVQGLVHYGMGHVAEAARAWEKVLKLDPKHPAAQRALARARLELGGKP